MLGTGLGIEAHFSRSFAPLSHLTGGFSREEGKILHRD